MRKLSFFFLSIVKFFKNLLIFFPVTLILYPLSKLALFLTYFNYLLVWVYKNKKYCKIPSPFTLNRDYSRRYKLYTSVSEIYNLKTEQMLYLEFGVAGGDSFRWWSNNNTHDLSRFWGFDTFEGLPENWSFFFKKGDMRSAQQTEDVDSRTAFVKGLFQDTLNPFLSEQKDILNTPVRKIIHMDADLYSSTLFVLSQLYPFLRKGDIIFFDEFNVPLHEFKAFSDFTKSFYVKSEPIGMVNNFYQTAFILV